MKLELTNRTETDENGELTWLEKYPMPTADAIHMAQIPCYQFEELLNNVPPLLFGMDKFISSEEYCWVPGEGPVYIAAAKRGGKYYSGVMSPRQFRAYL